MELFKTYKLTIVVVSNVFLHFRMGEIKNSNAFCKQCILKKYSKESKEFVFIDKPMNLNNLEIAWANFDFNISIFLEKLSK